MSSQKPKEGQTEQEKPETHDPATDASEKKVRYMTPGAFITFEMIQNILANRIRDEKQVSILESFGDTDHRQDSKPTPPADEERTDSEPPSQTINVPDDTAPTDPPPSFMARDTNRPPRSGDFATLAELLAAQRAQETRKK